MRSTVLKTTSEVDAIVVVASQDRKARLCPISRHDQVRRLAVPWIDSTDGRCEDCITRDVFYMQMTVFTAT